MLTLLETWEEAGYTFKLYEKFIKEGCWKYSVLEVNQGARNVVVLERNYSSFPYALYTCPVSGHDYLLCSLRYTGMTCVSLETGDVYDLPKAGPFGWCMAEYNVHPDKPFVAVTGCVWGGSYGVRVFDLSEPTKLPWPCVYEGGGPLEGDVCWSGNTVQYKVCHEYSDHYGKFYYELTDEEEEESEALRIKWEDRMVTETFDLSAVLT
jgi:hypothetical protein